MTGNFMATEPDNENGPFTPEYLRKEICAFRQLLGQKSFWAKPEVQRRGAVAALGVVYFRMTATAEEIEECARIYESALDEYGRREVLCITHGFPLGV